MQSIRNFVSDGKISIVGTLDVDIKASRMVCSVVAGSFLSTYFFPPNISRSAPGTTSQHSFPAIWQETIHRQKNFPPPKTQPFN
jgi:hypothetical protein